MVLRTCVTEGLCRRSHAFQRGRARFWAEKRAFHVGNVFPLKHIALERVFGGNRLEAFWIAGF